MRQSKNFPRLSVPSREDWHLFGFGKALQVLGFFEEYLGV